ncbi:MAG: hypothetical protein NTY19_26445 [Planctomycetota bacterium]|nr:hypothetical protein [Planctomycetota bacterium]
MCNFVPSRILACGLLWIALSPAVTLARGTAEAIPGQPFGVGHIVIPLAAADATLASSTAGMMLTERRGRTLYPVLTTGRFRKLLGEILGNGNPGVPDSLHAWFLFTGDGPLEVTLYTPQATNFAVTPQAARDGRAHQRLLTQWWREYNAVAREEVQQGDYPPLVQTYLTSMLSRRLGLEPPLLSRISERAPSEPQQTLELLLGLESLRLATLRRTSLGTGVTAEPADRPVPPEVDWTPRAAPATEPDVDIEPIARRVPQEFFYIRFGSFENYLWFDRLQKDYGDINQMITLRGSDAQPTQRMQRQLALRLSALAEVLGPTVIADVALIGRDLYLREGGALGVLFQARNALLGVDLNRQRTAALAAEKQHGATLTTVKIAGRDVSLLATPDNRLRSFYVADGDYHFISTSRALVQRFLEVSQGDDTLGNNAAFRHARSVLPTRREDTIFVYFSSAFFQGLLSPQYQVELPRRLRAATDLELLMLATWAARCEQRPAETVEDLVRGGLLPAGFDRRPDGSGPLLAGEKSTDSLRGIRGSFLPIPDVELRKVTATEAAGIATKSAYYSGNWKQLDPLMVGVKRFAVNREGRERVVVDAHVSPFAEEKYGWLMSLLGEPTRVRIRPAAGDVIQAQAAVKGGLLASQVSPHHLFLGVQDNLPLSDVQPSSLLKTLRMLQTTPGYLGAWPKPGFIDWLPLNFAGTQPNAAGYSRLPFDLWRRQWDDFSALSFDPKLLASVTPQLQPEEAENEAQIRIHVGDLSQAKLQAWVNSLTYTRAHQASLGNVRLLHSLSQQLGVPREEALQAGEQLLDAKLVCPLGGEYRLDQQADQVPLWTSTKWSKIAPDRAPPEYQTPLLQWFRGLDAELTKYGDRVVLHTTLDMQRKPKEAKADLPLFNLNWFGGGKAGKPETKETPKKPPDPPVRQARNGPREF